MTVDDELFKKANVVFSIEGGGVRERAAGQFAKSGTTAWNIGTGPRMEYIESPTAHNFREISGGPKASRAATSSLFRDGMQKQGKAWRKMLKNMPSEIDKLRSLPDRIALTALEANAAKNKTYGLPGTEVAQSKWKEKFRSIIDMIMNRESLNERDAKKYIFDNYGLAV